MTKTKKNKKGTFLGQALIVAADDAISWHKGERELRVTDIKVTPPPEYSKTKIKEIRKKFNVSQPVFASIIGCSPGAVKAWEQGLKKPGMAARRLLQIFNRDNKIVKGILEHNKESA